MIGEKGRDVTMVDFLRSRSFKQFFFLEEDFHGVNWTEEFMNYNYSEHAWELCNCMRNLRCNEALRPMHMGKDVCHFFQLNLIVFTKIWISTWPWPFIIVAVLLLIIRPFCLRAFWIYRLWDLHQDLSNPVVLNFWKNLEGILPEISPNFGGKNFWPQISTSLTRFPESLQIFLFPFGKGDH